MKNGLNLIPLTLIILSIVMIVVAEKITQNQSRVADIDKFATSLLFGSGVMYKREEKDG
jgi:hypothetical protein